MKTLEAVGNNFYVASVQKKLACRGSSNSETVCFKLDRYAGKADLSECNCIVKTRNSEGKSDLAVPEVTADDKKLNINWQPSSGATSVAGALLVQLQFEKIFDDSSKNISWQSNVMEFEISDSLDAADEIADAEPTLFQQWEEKVNTLYSDAAEDVQAMQSLQTQVQTDADAVAQQKQSVERTAAQVAQDAQNVAENEQNAATFAAAAQASAAQAQTSASDANIAQGLAKGYSDAAKTYSDAAAVSAQSAQAQADAAQKAVTEAQQKVDDFSGYTREEIDNGFANALVGEASGQSVTLDDMLPGTSFRSLLVTGVTAETGSGDKAPDNPHSMAGSRYIQISGGKNLFHPAAGTITVNGIACTVTDDGTITLDGVASGNVWITLTTELVGYAKTNSVPWAILEQGKPYIFSETVVSGTKSGTFYHTIRDTVSTAIPGSCIMNGSVSPQFVAGTPQTTGYSTSLYPGMLNLYAASGTGFDHFQYRIQVEQAGSATAWQPCTNQQIISLPQELYSLTDGTADSYDAAAGTGTQNIEKMILTGAESWAFQNQTDSLASFQLTIPGIRRYDYAGNSEILQCTHFKFNNNNLVYDAETEGVSVSTASDNLFLCILKSRFSEWSDDWTAAQKASALKTWLSSKQVTVLYQLTEPKTIECTPQRPEVSASGAVFSADTGTLQIKYQIDGNAALKKIISSINRLGGTY